MWIRITFAMFSLSGKTSVNIHCLVINVTGLIRPQLFLGCNLSIIFRMFSSFVHAELHLWEVGFLKKFLNEFELGSFMLAARFGPILAK